VTADSPGRGLTYAWDLDDDGAYDGATGADATTTFAAAGTKRVRVRATDEDGRTGDATHTLQVHVANLKPQSFVYVNPSSPRVGQPVADEIYAFDSDGTVVVSISTATATATAAASSSRSARRSCAASRGACAPPR
jgi:PKD repeat protein